MIGITTPELLLAHIVTQAVIVFLQCTEVIFFVGVVFGTVNNGNNLTVIFLLSLTGFAGMLFGMFQIKSYFLSWYNNNNKIDWWKMDIFVNYCRNVDFDLLWITYNGQFCIDRCILSDDCAVRFTLATWRNATTFARLCLTFTIYHSNNIGMFTIQNALLLFHWIDIMIHELTDWLTNRTESLSILSFHFLLCSWYF